MIRAVVLDLFRTLVGGFTPADDRALHAAMADASGLPRDEFARRWRASTAARAEGRLAVEEALRALGAETALPVRTAYMRRMLVPAPGAAELVAALRRRGLAVGLLSNCSSDVPGLFAESELAGRFDDTVFSCAVGLAKPDERIYRLAAERLGVDPAACDYADDRPENVEAARRVGMRAVLVEEAEVSRVLGLLDDGG